MDAVFPFQKLPMEIIVEILKDLIDGSPDGVRGALRLTSTSKFFFEGGGFHAETLKIIYQSGFKTSALHTYMENLGRAIGESQGVTEHQREGEMAAPAGRIDDPISLAVPTFNSVTRTWDVAAHGPRPAETMGQDFWKRLMEKHVRVGASMNTQAYVDGWPWGAGFHLQPAQSRNPLSVLQLAAGMPGISGDEIDFLLTHRAHGFVPGFQGQVQLRLMMSSGFQTRILLLPAEITPSTVAMSFTNETRPSSDVALRLLEKSDSIYTCFSSEDIIRPGLPSVLLSPIHMAALTQRNDIIRYLVGRDGNLINVGDVRGWTPLDYAMMGFDPQTETVVNLLALGATPFTRFRGHFTFLLSKWIISHPQRLEDYEPIRGRGGVILELLLETRRRIGIDDHWRLSGVQSSRVLHIVGFPHDIEISVLDLCLTAYLWTTWAGVTGTRQQGTRNTRFPMYQIECLLARGALVRRALRWDCGGFQYRIPGAPLPPGQRSRTEWQDTIHALLIVHAGGCFPSWLDPRRVGRLLVRILTASQQRWPDEAAGVHGLRTRLRLTRFGPRSDYHLCDCRQGRSPRWKWCHPAPISRPRGGVEHFTAMFLLAGREMATCDQLASLRRRRLDIMKSDDFDNARDEVTDLYLVAVYKNNVTALRYLAKFHPCRNPESLLLWLFERGISRKFLGAPEPKPCALTEQSLVILLKAIADRVEERRDPDSTHEDVSGGETDGGGGSGWGRRNWFIWTKGHGRVMDQEEVIWELCRLRMRKGIAAMTGSDSTATPLVIWRRIMRGLRVAGFNFDIRHKGHLPWEILEKAADDTDENRRDVGLLRDLHSPT